MSLLGLFGSGGLLDSKEPQGLLGKHFSPNQAMLSMGLGMLGNGWAGALPGLQAGLKSQRESQSVTDWSNAFGVGAGAPQGGTPMPAVPAPSIAPPTFTGPAPSSPAGGARAGSEIQGGGGIDPTSRDLITRTVLAEAGGESPEGMAAATHVIRNRMTSGRYGGSTAAGVVRSPNQFEPWNTPEGRSKIYGYDPNSQAYQRAAAVVDQVFGGGAPDPTKGATHFYAPVLQGQLGRNAPKWAAGAPLATIGGHSFYAPEGAVSGAATRGVGGAPAAGGGGMPSAPVPSMAGGMFTAASPQQRAALARIAAQNPAVGAAFISRMLGGGGEAYSLGPGQRRYDANNRLVAEGAAEQWFPLVSPEHRARFGIPPEDKRPYQVNPLTSEVKAVGGAGTNISLDRGENAFEVEVGKKNATLFSGMADQWTQSQSDLSDISQLRELLPRIGPGGVVGAANQALAKWGVPVEGGDAIQTFNAIINRLVPAQRAPGSGTMSDGDVKLFRDSLPQLMNSPEGNQRILDTMEAMARYKMQQAIIAQDLMAEGGSKEARQEAFKALRELQNPLEWLRKLRPSKEGAPATPQQGAAPQQRSAPADTGQPLRQPSPKLIMEARKMLSEGVPREQVVNTFISQGFDPSAIGVPGRPAGASGDF